MHQPATGQDVPSNSWYCQAWTGELATHVEVCVVVAAAGAAVRARAPPSTRREATVAIRAFHTKPRRVLQERSGMPEMSSLWDPRDVAGSWHDPSGVGSRLRELSNRQRPRRPGSTISS